MIEEGTWKVYREVELWPTGYMESDHACLLVCKSEEARSKPRLLALLLTNVRIS